MRLKILITLILWIFTANLYAQREVDTAEIYRMGNSVTMLGQGARSAGQDCWMDAIKPPVSDANKFFIVVISMENCRPCEQLLKDFARTPELQAFVNVASPKQSWSHFCHYMQEDETQAWRWEKLKLTKFPAIIIQPPLNGRYGSNSQVVMQKSGYNGNAIELSLQISDHIKKFIAAKSKPAAVVPHRGYQQLVPWQPEANAKPPFRPLRPKQPDQQIPAPFNPVEPAGPLDVDVPSPLNPDAPKPVDPAPATPEATPSQNQNPEAIIIVDGNRAADVFKDSRFTQVLARIKERYNNVNVQVKDFPSIKKLYPTLNETDLPALVVTKDGSAREFVTNLLLPLITPVIDSQDSTGTLSSILKTVMSGGTVGFLGWVVAAAVVAKLVRDRRKAKGLDPLIKNDSIQELLSKVLDRIGPAPAPPADPIPTPATK